MTWFSRAGATLSALLAPSCPAYHESHDAADSEIGRGCTAADRRRRVRDTLGRNTVHPTSSDPHPAENQR